MRMGTRKQLGGALVKLVFKALGGLTIAAVALGLLLKSGVLVFNIDRLPAFNTNGVVETGEPKRTDNAPSTANFFDPTTIPIFYKMVGLEGTKGIFPADAYNNVSDDDWEEKRSKFDEKIRTQIDQLEDYIEANRGTEVRFGKPPTLWSASCRDLGSFEINVLGDIEEFFNECSELATFDWGVWPASGGAIYLHFTGEITEELPRLFRYLHAVRSYGTRTAFTNFYTTLILESPGGDPYAAMNSGRLIFGAIDSVYAGSDGCASACIFLFAAGKSRAIVGVDDYRLMESNNEEDWSLWHEGFFERKDRAIAIHSPLPISETTVSLQELIQVRASFASDAKLYLADFGGSPAVVDLMLTIPSERVRYLTLDELKSFGLYGENILVQELDRLDIVENCGKEFEARRLSFNDALEMSCDHLFGAYRDKHGDAPWMRCRNQVVEELNISDETCPHGGFKIWDEEFISEMSQ